VRPSAFDDSSFVDSPRPSREPGDALLHPVAVAAVLLLIANDHFLKQAYPGLITGKLSDFAGIAFFPLLVVGAYEVAASKLNRWHGPAWPPLVVAIAATGVAFAVVKATPDGAALFSWMVGWSQWVVASLTSFLITAPAPVMRPVTAVMDPTDLVALIALLAALAIGSTRIAHARSLPVARRPA